MANDQPTMTQFDDSIQSPTVDTSYIYSTNPSESSATTEEQPKRNVSNNQTDTKLGNKKMNPTVTRVLGGLIGAALGSLAGALASKRNADGLNHAVRGVGNAFKTVDEGLSQAGKGAEAAAKSC